MKIAAAFVLFALTVAVAACDNGAKPAPGAAPSAGATPASTAPGAKSAAPKTGSGW